MAFLSGIGSRSRGTSRSLSGKKGQTSNKLNVDQIAELLDVSTWNEIDDRNFDYYLDQVDPDASEEEREKQENEARSELFHKYHDALLHAAKRAFGDHGLELTPVGKHDRPWEYKIEPVKSWEDAADRIRDTINGVGYFEFSSLREFLDSGPWTAREAVLGHLHTMTSRPIVYGDTRYKRSFERHFGD